MPRGYIKVYSGSHGLMKTTWIRMIKAEVAPRTKSRGEDARINLEFGALSADRQMVIPLFSSSMHVRLTNKLVLGLVPTFFVGALRVRVFHSADKTLMHHLHLIGLTPRVRV
jgi:hypothetical protein